MITVRFPSGFSIRYNDLCALKWGADGNMFFFKSAADRDAGKGWLVAVPRECVVEFITPCATYNASESYHEAVAQIAALERKVKTLTSAINKLVKRGVA